MKKKAFSLLVLILLISILATSLIACITYEPINSSSSSSEQSSSDLTPDDSSSDDSSSDDSSSDDSSSDDSSSSGGDINPDDDPVVDDLFNDGTYLYEFTQRIFTGHASAGLGDAEWALDGEYDDDVGYWGYTGAKGQQFGSAVYAYRDMTLTSSNFDLVSKVVVYTSGAKNTKATLSVTVGGVRIGESVALTATNAKYVFTSEQMLSGDVVLTYTQLKEHSSVAIYVKSISVTCGFIDETPESSDIPTDEEIDVNLETYSYTFERKTFSANGTAQLGGLNWTLSGEYVGDGYWSYDGTKGQQFGSKNCPYNAMSLVSEQINNVTEISINTSGANDIGATLSVYVGETKVGESLEITNEATEYTFKLNGYLSGAVKFEYSVSKGKAIYIKSITVKSHAGKATSEEDIHNLLALGVDYITLQNDIVVDSLVVVGNKFTLDLAGHRIDATEDRDGDESTYGLFAKGGAIVTITGNGTIYGGAGTNWNIALRASGDGSVINVLNGTFYSGPNKGDEGENGNSTMFVRDASIINIYGGFFYTEASYNNVYFVFNVAAESFETSTINVYGGTFVNANPLDRGIINIVGREFLGEGLTIKTTVVGNDKHYTVVEK